MKTNGSMYTEKARSRTTMAAMSGPPVRARGRDRFVPAASVTYATALVDAVAPSCGTATVGSA
jgi:hypothetical protein